MTQTQPRINGKFAKKIIPVNHTNRAYLNLSEAYDFFNIHLFDAKLPSCLITMQRKKNSRGYFSPTRFEATSDHVKTDEIALNPATFKDRTNIEVLSTLVHEQVHLWQHHNGKPAANNYHNHEWAAKMKALGLQPVDNKTGKETGSSMSHTIIADGLFETLAKSFLAKGDLVLYRDVITDGNNAKAKAKAASKTKYTCHSCDSNAWAKPNTCLKCGDCNEFMIAEG